MWGFRQMWLMIMDWLDFPIHGDISLYGLCDGKVEAGSMSILMLEVATLCDVVWWYCWGRKPFRVGENVRPMSCKLYGEGCMMGKHAMSWGNWRVRRARMVWRVGLKDGGNKRRAHDRWATSWEVSDKLGRARTVQRADWMEETCQCVTRKSSWKVTKC